MMKLPQILVEEREKRKLRQKDVAIQIGLLPDTYRKYEKGVREPDLDTLVKIANFYQTSTDYLLGRYS
jgi:transcriptional regulator with XRE-family HTH domain